MRVLKVLLCAVVCAAGCAHHCSDKAMQVPNEEGGPITIHIEGAVNRTGDLMLNRPLTVAHALREAGGINYIEEDANRIVRITRKNRLPITVLRRDYASFVLRDEDHLGVPSISAASPKPTFGHGNTGVAICQYVTADRHCESIG